MLHLLRFNLPISFFLLLKSVSFAQSCGAVVSSPCDLSAAEGLNGFANSDLLPCIVIGAQSEITIPFSVFSTLTFGGTDTVYKMHIRSVGNLPCGMCWITGTPSDEFGRGEKGCIVIRGNTHDVAGQFTLVVNLRFDTTGNGNYNANVNLDVMGGWNEKLVVRVITPDAECAGVNSNLQGNTAGTTGANAGTATAKP